MEGKVSGRSQFEQLPRRLQSTIAIVITIVIAAVAYFVGRDRPVPVWIENFLIPALGWLGVVLIVLAAADWLRERRRAGRKPPPEE